MIPFDQYTVAVLNLLLLFGLVGLVRPNWFIHLSGFPFFFRARQRKPITDAEQRTARRWGLVCLVMALVLFLMTRP